ncbi:hypothetical protein ElyMa_004681600 [Elysia marginata]|uniref:Uncharacterized protein n=1 Tax=Elysia marginata TaxID=1093978 RepID=A0AAV4I6B3_9GAST|nr:hypothetical protein ElyMa_004681600 [Elysia marginata]
MITGDALHTGSTQRRPTKQVTTTNDQTDLNTNADQLTDFKRHTIQHLGINAKLFAPHQRFATEFQENTMVFGLAICSGHVCSPSTGLAMTRRLKRSRHAHMFSDDTNTTDHQLP